jgi:hypothetical protein
VRQFSERKLVSGVHGNDRLDLPAFAEHPITPRKAASVASVARRKSAFRLCMHAAESGIAAGEIYYSELEDSTGRNRKTLLSLPQKPTTIS